MCSGAFHSSPGHCARGAFRGHTLAVDIYTHIYIYTPPQSRFERALYIMRLEDATTAVELYIVAVHRVYYIIIVIVLRVYINILYYLSRNVI